MKMSSNTRVIHALPSLDGARGRTRAATGFEHGIYAPGLFARLFALRSIAPFDRLTEAELTLIAEVARPRSYPPGTSICSGDEPLSRLLAVTGGCARDAAGAAAGPLVGVASLLHRQPAPPLTADPVAGARCLEIGRRHFFTLVGDCPEFVLGLLELGENGARVR